MALTKNDEAAHSFEKVFVCLIVVLLKQVGISCVVYSLPEFILEVQPSLVESIFVN
jgi:hypothetical protein